MEIIVTRARKIYSDGKHNAFTGIARFRDKTYICFRSGQSHITLGSTIKVIASGDHEDWSVAAEKGVVAENVDNRDPKIAAFKNNLLVYYPESTRTKPEGPDKKLRFMTFRSEDGENFGEPQQVQGLPERVWLWWVAPREGKLYGAGYGGGRRLIAASDDGINWSVLTDLPVEEGNETSFDFDPDGSMWTLTREDSLGYVPTVCVLEPPYTEVKRKFRLPMRLQGPMIKRLPGGSVIVCRQRDRTPPGVRHTRTEILWLPDDTEDPQRVCVLPSGGDTSYAGWADVGEGKGVVSYYSSHEHEMAIPSHLSRPADIFLADVSYTP